MPRDAWSTWRAATERALYGHDDDPGGARNGEGEGFFVREGPAAHFRTSVHASPLFAGAVARLLCRVDEALGRPGDWPSSTWAPGAASC